MKFKHVLPACLLIAVALVTCKTEEKRPVPKPVPVVPVAVVPPPKPVLSFSQPRYGAADMDWMTIHPDTLAYFLHGAPFTTYNYSITGGKGLLHHGLQAAEGQFTTDSTGAYAWNCLSLADYKDGDLTLTVVNTRQPADSFATRTVKEQYVIRNYRDFLAMGRHAKTSGHKVAYTQACDFAFPDTTFRDCPVPVKFGSSYNGKGHTISNLTIYAPYRRRGTTDVALFDTLDKDAVLKNVRLVLSARGIRNANVNAYTAGLATVHYGTIRNCSVKGTIRFADSSGMAGGLVAEAQHARIIGSSFTGRLEGNKVAGIVGNMQYTEVDMCYANFAAKSNGMIAGILGFTYLGDTTGQATAVRNCFVHFSKLEGAAAPKAGAIATDDFQNRETLLVSNCYSNGPMETAGSTTYTTLDELNLAIGTVTVTTDDAQSNAPPHDKPFRANRNINKAPLLWWQ
ncbi:hypothetical protein DCC81_23485 [Chitinophaga parva]|uniref:GLUG domain-containing protein n=1 Tax=Chitinophaga parva TaxID=2169414 RepID=A0A2T7BE93_9BACT|nr:hypothetical protein [Chitinophaga parva]PUZ23350.1 hypothetical protein DCC81_23485 [Chitinophaga parva]